MVDNAGAEPRKSIGVPNCNPRYDQVHNLDQLFPHTRREIEHFFTIYKELEGKKTCRWVGGAVLWRRGKGIVRSRKAFLDGKASNDASLDWCD